jgi:hypothetical protein
MRSIGLIVALALTGAVYAQEQEHVYDIDNLPFEAEKSRLDNAAVMLSRDPNKVVFLIGFNSSRAGKNSAVVRLRQAKRYLQEKHRIPAHRIRSIYGGLNTGLIMRIYVIDKPKPK